MASMSGTRRVEGVGQELLNVCVPSEELGARTCGQANQRAEGRLHVCVLGGKKGR